MTSVCSYTFPTWHLPKRHWIYAHCGYEIKIARSSCPSIFVVHDALHTVIYSFMMHGVTTIWGTSQSRIWDLKAFKMMLMTPPQLCHHLHMSCTSWVALVSTFTSWSGIFCIFWDFGHPKVAKKSKFQKILHNVLRYFPCKFIGF